MKLKNIYNFAIFGILLFALACNSGEETIPEPVKPPEPPPAPEDIFNKPDFVPHKEGEPFDSYRGLVMAGYQGWFNTPDDGADRGWYHYRESNMFAPGPRRNSIDMWPEMREYEVKYTTDNFILPNGQKAQVYSNYDKSSVMLHFKWMKEYGIDGAFMQRFVGEVIDNPSGKNHFDAVLGYAMEASNTHQRALCVMYDLGGFVPDRLAKTLDDAQTIMNTYQLKDRTKQKFYLHQNGKPLITVWGVGFNDGRPFSLTDVESLVNGLKEMGYSIMLGVPTYWRERRNDALPDPKLHEIIRSADVIMPWFVGRYGMNNFPDFHTLIESDIQWCKTNNVEYAPLCFPGSSDLNMHPHNIDRNERYGGQFLWNQMYHSIKSGAQMLYMAMFDEIDEGTALYKTLNQKDVPGNEPEEPYYVTYRGGNYSIGSQPITNLPGANDWCKRVPDELNITFLGIEDNLPTDHYLWLTGQGRKMLRGEIPLKQTLPVRQ
ncbi:glycoside hydrolase family 71/99-like protein [uncultured Proteiniphilum sp.]|uniref:glycoside hydrolase family 71/99-like protein n=1 Tax=uncultured Proteiniphilum sp. TaxID=497637 RepID=UPI00261CE5D1|nr:glycoside hydrolase family 71/99-like protein [uncultured Proteiniphilum sp.]